jgi:hypothetical protein
MSFTGSAEFKSHRQFMPSRDHQTGKSSEEGDREEGFTFQKEGKSNAQRS